MKKVTLYHIRTCARELGLKLCPLEDTITPGDLYLAGRSKVNLLTCKSVDEVNRWIVPAELGAYIYDIEECYKVQERTIP